MEKTVRHDLKKVESQISRDSTFFFAKKLDYLQFFEEPDLLEPEFLLLL